MIYLSSLSINRSRLALGWMANPYRVHQRLCMACDRDPRLLFRIEEQAGEPRILVQSQRPPDWPVAFAAFQVLSAPPDVKEVDMKLLHGQRCRFRLLANPAVKKDGRRLGLIVEADQRSWLTRKLGAAGADLLGCWVINRGLQKSTKKPTGGEELLTHQAVLFEGALQVREPPRLVQAVESGIGPAKGLGFGLLSLAGMSY